MGAVFLYTRSLTNPNKIIPSARRGFYTGESNMNTIQFIKSALETSKGSMMGLFEDLKDAPLAQPTTSGGNHALWILGHLVCSESFAIHQMVLGEQSNPVADWQPLFGMGSSPQTDPTLYPSYAELQEAWEEVRAHTLKTLDTFTDADLDTPAPGCPEEWASWFGTIGKVYTAKIIHPTMHYGQLTDIRRALGRDRLMA